MDEQPHGTEMTVSSGGITVNQLYTEEEFDVPSVVLRIVSDREGPTDVHLVVPEIDARKVGFHPEFGGESWSIDDDVLTFEAEIGADEEITTIYAVETENPDVCHRAMESLQIETTVPADDDSSNSPESNGAAPETTDTEEAVDDTESTGETELEEESAKPEEDGVEADDEDVETEADREEETDEGGTEEIAVTDGHTQEAGLAEQPTDQLVDELVVRFENNELSEQQRQQFRAVGLEPAGQAGADDARITDLQRRMSDVEAFTESIERLFEQHGPPAEVFDEFERRVAAVEDVDERVDAVDEGLDTVREEVETTATRVDGVEADIDDIEATVETVETNVEEVTETVEVVESDVAQLEETVTDIEELGDSLREEVSDIDETVEEVNTSTAAVEGDLRAVEDWLAGVDDRLDTLSDEQSEVASEFDEFESQVGDMTEKVEEIEAGVTSIESAVEDIEADIEDVEAEVEEIEEWRERVTGALEVFMQE
jgi:chromosome segregation ATPase